MTTHKKKKLFAKDIFLTKAKDIITTHQRPFDRHDFKFSQTYFNKLVNSCKNEIIKIGKDKYMLLSLLKAYNSENLTIPLGKIVRDQDNLILIYFLNQNIHNIRSNIKGAIGLYDKLKLYYELKETPFKEIQISLNFINGMDIEVSIYRNDTIKIIIGCSNKPIIINKQDIDKLIDTYKQIRNLLLQYSQTIPPIDKMRITQFYYARDFVLYKVGPFGTFGMEFQTFFGYLGKIYNKDVNLQRIEKRIANVELSLKQLIDKLLPITFN